jgi:hypothetical protein
MNHRQKAIVFRALSLAHFPSSFSRARARTHTHTHVVCTVASTTGPAAKESKIRGGDKLVAIFRPAMPVAAVDVSGNESPSKTTRAVRVCVVDCDVAKVRQILLGKAGEGVVLEFLRAAECCPSDEALVSATFGKPRNTFSVRIVREPIIDFKFVERSATVGVKPIEDLWAEQKLQVALDDAYKQQEKMEEAKKERKNKRVDAKAVRKIQLEQHFEKMRKMAEEQKQQEFDAKVAKAREKVDAKQALVDAQAAELLAVLQAPTLDSGFAMMQHLEELHLNNLSLTTLPPHLRGMTALKILHLSNNRLSALSSWFGELLNLEILALGNNLLHELPTAMSKLKNLQHLDVRTNPRLRTVESISNT